MKEKRLKTIKVRKNFFLTLLIICFLWLTTLSFIFFIDPDTSGAIPILFILLFSSLLFTFSTILTNTRRGFLAASGISLFLILRFLGVGNILNLLLLLGLIIVIEILLQKR